MHVENCLFGTTAAKTVIATIKEQIITLKNQHNCRAPQLAVILVGDDPASIIYVKNKHKACKEAGIKAVNYLLPEATTPAELLHLIDNLNNDSNTDGILLQLPLPKQLHNQNIIDKIAINKDVDGFHRYNIGSLAINHPQLSPCTPLGIIYLLDSLNINYAKQHVVILGTSNIVGRPMLLELINRNATVTICNSKTANIMHFTQQADILIIAIGQANLVKRSWLKSGVIVIDVGINHLADGSVCGDVDFNDVKTVARYITPVPGGVGPMTVAMLVANTFSCYKRHIHGQT